MHVGNKHKKVKNIRIFFCLFHPNLQKKKHILQTITKTKPMEWQIARTNNFKKDIIILVFYVHTYTYIHIHMHICVCVYVWMYVCMQVCLQDISKTNTLTHHQSRTRPVIVEMLFIAYNKFLTFFIYLVHMYVSITTYIHMQVYSYAIEFQNKIRLQLDMFVCILKFTSKVNKTQKDLQ